MKLVSIGHILNETIMPSDSRQALSVLGGPTAYFSAVSALLGVHPKQEVPCPQFSRESDRCYRRWGFICDGFLVEFIRTGDPLESAVSASAVALCVIEGTGGVRTLRMTTFEEARRKISRGKT